jgi:hypothetical protein
VRSHAKALPVGSNSDRGASRRSLRRPGVFALLLVALVAAACLLPGSAFAIEQRSVVESFGPDGTSGTSFARPEELAFDQGNTRLYALDAEAQEIHGFDASTPATHTPLGGSFPLSAPGAAELDDIGVNSSSHDLYFASVGENKLFGFDSSGASLSGFPLPGQNFSCGVATDSSGDIWVAEGNEEKLRKYSPAGALLETITIGGSPCDLAFDSNDNLYVAFYFGATKKYTAASNYTASVQIDGELSGAVAVDPSTDEVYVAHPVPFPNPSHISVYEADGTFLYEFGKEVAFGEAEFSGVAIDPSTEQVYASAYDDSFAKKVLVFGPPLPFPKVSTEGADGVTTTTATVHGTVNPKGEALTDCHFEVVPSSQYQDSKFNAVTAAQEFPCVPAAGSIPADSNPHAVSADVSGLEFATTYNYRLVATNATGTTNGSANFFVTDGEAPLIKEPFVETVGTEGATLRAKINPQGGETTYHVEYGTTSAYGQSTAESAPIGSSTDKTYHLASVNIGGLSPGTAYHFRFVATNSAGTAQGTDVSFATYPDVPPPSGSCSNEQFRTGFGARLPDCRAYEQATPIDKHGADAQGDPKWVEASSSGDRVTFFVTGGLPTSGGAVRLAPFVASRGARGWSSDGLLPLTDPQFGASVTGWSEDLSTTVGEWETATDTAFYLRDNGGAYQRGPSDPQRLRSLALADFADDTSHLLFETESQLLPEAPGPFKPNLYELDHGTLTLPGRIPAGAATSCDDESGSTCIVAPNGTFAGPYNWTSNNLNAFGGVSGGYYTRHTISEDGSKVFFTAAGTGQLYMREDGIRTTRISASQRSTADPNGEKPAAFVGATADGSKVFFLSCEKLTDDSTAVSVVGDQCNVGQDLYSYDTGSGELTDLSVDTNPSDTNGASVQGLLGTSRDGSYVYFAANGVLASGAPSSGSKLYVSHDETTKFIASVGESHNWTPLVNSSNDEKRKSRVSADGRTLLFRASESLTGYDNTEATVGACGGLGNAPCKELYIYRLPEEEILCVSCNPANTRPKGNADLSATTGSFLSDIARFTFMSRNLSADGDQVFFNSDDQLVPQDVNDAIDVYEWEAKGSGSCETEAQNGGCIYLLSGGDGQYNSYFADASTNGDHVFLFSNQRLVPGDEDDLYDVYDAGVGAGLAAQHPLTPPTCTTSACQVNPPPPPEQTAASAVFSGQGNVHARSTRKCPKGKRKVRKAGKTRCLKAHKQSKRHSNRGGAK